MRQCTGAARLLGGLEVPVASRAFARLPGARQVVGLTRMVVPLVAHHDAQRPAALAAMRSDFNGTWSGVSYWASERLNPLTPDELERFGGGRRRPSAGGEYNPADNLERIGPS